MRNPNDLITNFADIQVGASTANGQRAQKKDTQIWINVGLRRNGKLVSLPMGIALDELKERKVPSPKTQNQEFRNLRLAEAQLWAKMKEIMASLKPGETKVLPFEVEIRKVDEKEVIEDVDQSENPFAIGDLKL